MKLRICMNLTMRQNKVVNRNCLIERIVAESGIRTEDVSVVLDTMFKTIARSLKEQECVSIRGFGSWHVDNLPEKEIYSPLLGKKIVVGPRSKVTFRPGTQLRIARE